MGPHLRLVFLTTRLAFSWSRMRNDMFVSRLQWPVKNCLRPPQRSAATTPAPVGLDAMDREWDSTGSTGLTVVVPAFGPACARVSGVIGVEEVDTGVFSGRKPWTQAMPRSVLSCQGGVEGVPGHNPRHVEKDLRGSLETVKHLLPGPFEGTWANGRSHTHARAITFVTHRTIGNDRGFWMAHCLISVCL